MATPGRSTVIISIICVVAVGGAAFYAYGQSGAGIETKLDQHDQVSVYTTGSSPAMNGTGTTTNSSSDWRSQFAYATTSQNDLKNGTGKTALKAQTTPDTITSTLGIDMMAKFADLKQANLLGNADIVNQTVNNMLSSDLSPTQPKTYAIKDLRVTTATDAGSMTAFADSLADLINSYAATTSESSVLQDYSANNDSSVLPELDLAIREQKRILAGLLAMSVPQPLVQDYLNLVNGMSALESASESIRVIDSDSVRGLMGSSQHVSGAQQITDALSTINHTLGADGVVFGLHWEILNPLLN